jgi:spore germination cell wall hydrolase CwlJ-like protein
MQFIVSKQVPGKRFPTKLFLEVLFVLVGLAAASVSLIYATESKIQKHLQAGTAWKQNFTTSAERDQQLACLALNVYKEAGYEPFEGKVAVAQVTMNRVVHQDFPKSVCGVVYQKSMVLSKTVCQFSWYCDPDHKRRAVNPEAYQESYEAAKRVLLENYRLPGLKDALYYHADYVRPGWPHQKLTKIGNHIFYSPKS